MADNVAVPVTAGFAAGIALIVILSLSIHPTTLSFSSNWHHAGNETISGALANQISAIPPMPIAANPMFVAQKYINGNNGTTAYLVARWEGHKAADQNGNVISVDEYDTIVINSHIYCVWTNSTSIEGWLIQYAKCPSLIN
jgi:hypothetical protein